MHIILHPGGVDVTPAFVDGHHLLNLHLVVRLCFVLAINYLDICSWVVMILSMLFNFSVVSTDSCEYLNLLISEPDQVWYGKLIYSLCYHITLIFCRGFPRGFEPLNVVSELLSGSSATIILI